MKSCKIHMLKSDLLSMINKLQQLFNKENQTVCLQLQDDLSFAQPLQFLDG